MGFGIDVDTWYGNAGSWHRDDLVNRCVNRIKEFNPEMFSSILVPPTGTSVLGVRFLFETWDSPPTKFSFGAASNVFPRCTGGLAGQDAAGSLLNLSGPGSFHTSRIFGFGFVQARQEFGNHVSPLVERQRESFAQNLLRP